MRPPALYPIIDLHISCHPLEHLLSEFAASGIRWVQLRAKGLNSRQFLEQALHFVQLTHSYGMTAIINDRPDIALFSGADGVHVGQDDLPVEGARSILGSQKIIGLSTHNSDQAKLAQESSADYVAIGPVFATSSKANPDPVLRSEEVRLVRKVVSKPLVAIGGISAENSIQLFRWGIDSVAVIRDLMCASDIRKRIADYCTSEKPAESH